MNWGLFMTTKGLTMIWVERKKGEEIYSFSLLLFNPNYCQIL